MGRVCKSSSTCKCMYTCHMKLSLSLSLSLTLTSHLKHSGCYLGIYAGLGAVQAVFIVMGTLFLVLSTILASHSLHSDILKSILRSPMSFFDNTPLSRVLHHFSKVIYITDDVIPRSIHSFIFTLLTLFCSFIIIIIVTPFFVIVAVPLVILYFLVLVRNSIHVIWLLRMCTCTSSAPYGPIPSFRFHTCTLASCPDPFPIFTTAHTTYTPPLGQFPAIKVAY